MKANVEIRNKIESNRILYWEVAEQVGINQSNLSVWFRTEMSNERKERVERAVETLLKSRGEN